MVHSTVKFWGKRALRAVGIDRARAATVRLCCERHALALLGGRPKRRYVGRILCYHGLGQPEFGVNNLSPRRFRQHIETALDRGFRFVPAETIAQGGGGPKDLALTFDDGLKSVLSEAAPLLADYRIPFTIFPVSEWSAGRHFWDAETILTYADIETLMGMGAALGGHSATHPNFRSLSADAMSEELGGARRALERAIGVAPASFAAPFGTSRDWPLLAGRLAREAGYQTVYAQAEDTRPAGTVARSFISSFDDRWIFSRLLAGVYDRWEEWS